MSGLRPGTTMGRIAALEQDKLMCPGHWRRLPQPLKGAVLRAWDGGRGAGSPAHLAAIRAAIAAANRQEADR